MFIRECDEKNDLIKPKMREEVCRIRNHCLANSRRCNGKVDWRLNEIGVFGSYASSSSSSYFDDRNDNGIRFPSSFSKHYR